MSVRLAQSQGIRSCDESECLPRLWLCLFSRVARLPTTKEVADEVLVREVTVLAPMVDLEAVVGERAVVVERVVDVVARKVGRAAVADRVVVVAVQAQAVQVVAAVQVLVAKVVVVAAGEPTEVVLAGPMVDAIVLQGDPKLSRLTPKQAPFSKPRLRVESPSKEKMVCPEVRWFDSHRSSG